MLGHHGQAVTAPVGEAGEREHVPWKDHCTMAVSVRETQRSGVCVMRTLVQVSMYRKLISEKYPLLSLKQNFKKDHSFGKFTLNTYFSNTRPAGYLNIYNSYNRTYILLIELI